MPSSGHGDQRSKDVLFALSAASDYNQQLGRLALQKLIYLFDVIALAWRQIGAQPGFRPWHNGPYDPMIQNAVDALAFRGLVNITDLSFRRTKNAECRYSLTDAGKTSVGNLSKSSALGDDLALFCEIAREIERRGWNRIKEIVYAEPTYSTARATEHGTMLSLDRSIENLSYQLLRDVREAFEMNRDTAMPRRTLVQVMFAILDEYRLTPDAKFHPENR